MAISFFFLMSSSRPAWAGGAPTPRAARARKTRRAAEAAPWIRGLIGRLLSACGEAVGGLLYQGAPRSATWGPPGEPDRTAARRPCGPAALPDRRLAVSRGLDRLGPPVEWR